MDTDKAIFLGLALIPLAIFATDAMRPAQAGLMGGGRYMGTSGTALLWIVDTETGTTKMCLQGACGKWQENK